MPTTRSFAVVAVGFRMDEKNMKQEANKPTTTKPVVVEKSVNNQELVKAIMLFMVSKEKTSR